MKKLRFPEGVMTQDEWIDRHADSIEQYFLSTDDLFDRRRFNQMLGTEQDEYMRKLAIEAAKPRYRAWKGDVFQPISKASFEKFRGRKPLHAKTR